MNPERLSLLRDNPHWMFGTKMARTFTKSSPTYLVTTIRHQHRCNRSPKKKNAWPFPLWKDVGSTSRSWENLRTLKDEWGISSSVIFHHCRFWSTSHQCYRRIRKTNMTSNSVISSGYSPAFVIHIILFTVTVLNRHWIKDLVSDRTLGLLMTRTTV